MILQVERLNQLLLDIFKAAGAPPDIARYVASSLVDSSLKGVDSHGVMRVSQYVEQVLSGWIQPKSRPRILEDSLGMAVVTANSGFGIFALGYAMDLAIAKAKANRVAAVGLVDCTHTGRLGQFVEQAAEKGIIAMVIGGGHKGPGRSVAPYGGAQRIMATNPLAIGLPAGQFVTVVVDIATSTTAEGKLQVYRAEKKELPAGWILDKEGKPSTNVEDFYSGGMLLPAAGHKGYGLALAAELLGGALLDDAHELNWLIVAIDVAPFRDLAEYGYAAEEFLREVKAVPPATGFEEVLIPGELETRSAKRRTVGGIPLSDDTWGLIEEAARRVGVRIDPDLDPSR